MEIRRMKPEDASGVAGIEKKYFSQPWSREGFLSSLRQDYSIWLVAEENGVIAGYCGMNQSFDEAEITNVAVDGPFRKRGLGFTLVTALLSEGRERGITRYLLEVREGNEDAIRLYKRLGFMPEGKRKNFYQKPVEDAVIMTRVLE